MGGQFHFREEMENLKSRLVEMAGRAEEAVRAAVESLLERDMGKAKSVVDGDKVINDLEIEIDERVIQLLALQQPMARDLRFILMAMKISNDLERVGDHAVNIAEEVIYLLDRPRVVVPPEIEEMVKITSGMLNDALACFIRQENELAREVVTRDDRVDDLHQSVFRILLTHMMENPRNIGPGMDMLLVSRNLERIADLATNVAEDVVYLVEGKMIKHHAETGPREATG